jgi:hypothetical protein
VPWVPSVPSGPMGPASPTHPTSKAELATITFESCDKTWILRIKLMSVPFLLCGLTAISTSFSSD